MIAIEDKIRNINSKGIYCGGSKSFNYEDVKYFIEIETNSGCKLISKEYVNSSSKLEITCPCGNSFEVTLDKFKGRNKRLCNKCSLMKRNKNLTKTHTRFVEEVKVLSGGEFEVLGLYVDDKKEILLKHTICGQIFSKVAGSFLQLIKSNGGCNECSKNRSAKQRSLTHEEFLSRVKQLEGENYQVLSEYTKSVEKVEFYHKECDHFFSMSPNSFLQGRRCPNCKRTKLSKFHTKTHETFVEEVKDRVGDDYEILGEYQTSSTKIKMFHRKCSKEYYVAPSKFISGDRCPHCNLSKGARFIPMYLDLLNVNYTIEKKFDKCKNYRHLPFDFLVEDRILIEYDGDFHFVPARYSSNKEKMIAKLESTQRNDRIKNQYCIDNNIVLIRIPCWEIENLLSLLEQAFSYLGLIEKSEGYQESLALKYIVDKNWNHDEYINGYRRAYWLEKKENFA